MSDRYNKYILIAAALIAVAVIIVSAATLALGRWEGVDGKDGLTDALQKGADKPYCILVSGEDRVAGLYDVMMLVSVDMARERICVMQIPRDTYAEYTDGSYKKLNGGARSLGGAAGLRAFLEQSLGVAIDGYLTLDLSAFRNIIDTLGGVEIELDEPICYNDPEQELYIDLPEGVQTLDGEKAEMLVRYRKGYADGDLGRLNAQKKFLAALFSTLKEKVNSDNAYRLAASLIAGVDTDIDIATAAILGLEALSVEKSSLFFATAPGEQTTAVKSGASYYVISAEATDELLCEYFGKDETRVFDKNKLLCHPSYDSFISIYQSERKPSVVSASELE